MNRRELQGFVGDMRQVASVARYEYCEGPERGVEVIHFDTGSGFEFDVMPSRGLDIAAARYCGKSLVWLTANGMRHPAFYEPEGLGWLRNFCGGLVATCGLSYAGSPGPDPDHANLSTGAPTEDAAVVKLGLHGRVDNTPARNVFADADWVGDEYRLTAGGRVRETMVFGDNLELRRTVSAVAGQAKLTISDVVTNNGAVDAEQMLIYHMNVGYPVLSPNSYLVSSASEIEPRDPVAAAGLATCHAFGSPSSEFPEQVFYHHQQPDTAGFCQAGVINPDLQLGIGVSYRGDTLDQFMQWKSMAAGTYVCGLEPANCRVGGRADERTAGRLKYLAPGASREFGVTVEVLDGQTAIDAFVAKAKR